MAQPIPHDASPPDQPRAALERSEREFRLLAENATDLITRHGLDSTFRYASPSVTALLGWTPDEIIGRPAFDLIHPEDQEATRVALAELTEVARPRTTRYRMAHSDGRWVWVETVARRVASADGGEDELHSSTRDLTVQVAAERAERDAQELFRLAFDHAPIGMALVGLDGSFTRVNAALCALLERTEADLLTRTFQELTDPQDLDIDLDQLHRLTAGEIPHYAMEKRYLAPDGGRIWAQLSVSLLRDADGRPQGYVSQVQDIGERKRLQETLQHLADHDVLSGLWNRRRFEEELRREINRARRHGPSAALLLLDLDRLKQVNDTFGHPAGDELIRGVAGAVRARLRDTDALARIGGDEFAILLAGADLDAALLVARELCTAVRDRVIAFDGHDLRTTTSVGVTLVRGEATRAEDLLAAADRAMYAAKARGGDRAAADD
jgi:diguanylate cyclase (GGDEF)-like protein/PAS domain S-box-containing protein